MSALPPKADAGPQADTALFIQLAPVKPSSLHRARRLVIMSQGFQTVHLAARPERRNNHSQHFSLWGLGRRVERLGSRFHRTIVPSDANFHAKRKE